jgi:probable HAF family extracellular repeat protein
VSLPELKLRRWLTAALLLACITSVAAAQTPTYLNLPVPADTLSVTYGVNQLGQVVGSYFIRGTGNQLFVWKDGVTTLIGAPSSTPIIWAAINNLGQVTYTVDAPMRSYLWDNGTSTFIGEFAVAAINDQATITGCQESLVIRDTGVHESVIWNDGTLDYLAPQGGGTPFSCAFSINNSDQVAGAFYDIQGRPISDAYVWHQGITTLVGTLGGSITQALGINNSGQVVGVSATGDGTMQAFLWQNGLIQGLGYPAGEAFSMATKIDTAGRVVGNSRFPWVWQNGIFTPLNGGTCSGANCAVPVAIGIADLGTGAIVNGMCVNTASPGKHAACIWIVPAAPAIRKR